MHKLNEDLKKYLDDLDKTFGHDGEKFSFDFIKTTIWIKKNLDIQEVKKIKISLEEEAEALAYRFCANLTNKNYLKEGFFILMFERTGEFECLKNLIKEKSEYWKYWMRRSKEVKNPILISLYSGLTIQFMIKKNYSLIEKFVESNLILIKNKNFKEITKEIIRWNLDSLLPFTILKNSFKLSFSKAVELSNEVKDKYHCGIWGFPLWYINHNHKRIKYFLSNDEIQVIVKNFEKRFSEISSEVKESLRGDFFPYKVLAEYYARQKLTKKLIEVLEPLYCFVKKKLLEPNIKYFDLIIYSQAILKIYSKYKNLINSKYKIIVDEFSKIKYNENGTFGETFNINFDLTDDVAEIKKFIFKDKTLRKQIVNFVNVFNNSIKNLTNQTSKNNQMSHPAMARQVGFERDSILMSDFIFDDILLNDKKIAFAKKDIVFEFSFLILQKIINEFKLLYKNYKDIYLLFMKITFFDKWTINEKKTLKKALEAYWSNDYLISSHLMVPILERIIYQLVETLSSEDIYQKYSKKNMDNLNVLLMQTELFENIFIKYGNELKKVLSKDFCFILRFILSSQFGYNYRNILQHGLDIELFSTRKPSDWFFWILCFFLLI